jgi:hypothetical protein
VRYADEVRKKGKVEKLKRYRAMLVKVDTFKDGLGLGVDKEIRKSVALFNLLGLKTTMSCAGHLDPHHGEVSPWVDIERRNKKQELRARKLIRAYWQYTKKKRGPEIAAIQISDDIPRILRIQVGPSHFNSIRKEKPKMPLAVRKWFLAEGTKEMQALTDYLWKRYRGEVKAVYNAPRGRRL